MRPSNLQHALPAALAVLLSSCAWGAYLPPMTALERASNGTYEGVGVGGTGRVPYRLTLTIIEKQNKASGAIINLESQKTYAVNGTFKRSGPDSGYLELQLYQSGNKHRGNLHGQLQGTKISGLLRTVLFGKELLGYTIEFNKVENLPPMTPGP